jgi:hypothetical protein
MFFSRCRQVDQPHAERPAGEDRWPGGALLDRIAAVRQTPRPKTPEGLRREHARRPHQFTDLAAFVPSQKRLSQVLGT